MKIFKKILLYLFILVISVIILGFLYEQVARLYVRNKYPPQGKMVDVGGHKLCMQEEGKGEPCVVFENGLTDGHIVWYKVQNQVAKFTTTISYDRAGVLWSERGHNPKTIDAISTELYALLKKSGQKGPYILVGHSFASVSIYSFVYKYPKEVAGIVFVDCQNPLFLYYKDEFPQHSYLPPVWFYRLKSTIGYIRLFEPINRIYETTQKNDPINIVTNLYYPVTYSEVMEEAADGGCQLAEEALRVRSKMGSFGSIPLIVLTATKNKFSFMSTEAKKMEMHKNYLKTQRDYLSLSTDSKQLLCDKSYHHIQLDDPELVVGAIKELVEKYRKKNKSK